MKTADLIAALAADPAARQARTLPAFGLAALLGAAITLVCLYFWMPLLPMPAMPSQGWFWMKMAYTVALALAGLAIIGRLASPGRGLGWAPLALVASASAMAVLAGLEIARATPAQMPGLFLGHSAQACSVRILVLSVPVYAVTIAILRRFAPTRLATSGAAAGLLAGAVAASVYNLCCMETAATFVLIWFTLGIAVCAGLGALVGARLLRW